MYFAEYFRTLHKTLDCVQRHSYNCTANELSYIQKALYLMGNSTHEWCPGQTEHICAMSGAEARDVTQQCDELGLRTCARIYYENTYNKDMTNSQYCR